MSREVASAPPAALAKGALRRLAQSQLEPTPENFAIAYAEEEGIGTAVSPGAASRTRVATVKPIPPASPAPVVSVAPIAWPALIERLVRNLERGGKQWTTARRKESLHHVLASSRSDGERLAQRMLSLLQAWESDRALEGIETLKAADTTPAESLPGAAAAPTGAERAEPVHALLRIFNDTVRVGLGEADTRAAGLARRLAVLGEASAAEGATRAGADELVVLNGEAQRWFTQRHEIVRQLEALCAEMSQGMVDLAEEESWSRGQCEALRAQLAQPLDVQGLRAVSAALAETRTRQSAAKRERQVARVALKQLLAGMIGEVGALQQQAGGFESAIEQHAAAVEAADSVEGLTAVVQTLLADSRRIRGAIGATHERLRRDGERAGALEGRVRELETQLGRLSDEAHTDALTRVANRRGLERLFLQESARAQKGGAPLAVGLLDVDNFKKLNDRLGHAAGDQALKALAAAVGERLRPVDHVARYGGEEFVVLLRGLALAPAQEALTRLQRGLSASLFLHDGEEVLVTFSAGVTLWREGEALEAAIERADAGLYEAKRAGKNRTCAV